VLLCGIAFAYGSKIENKNPTYMAPIYLGAAISIMLTNNLLIIFMLFEIMMLSGTFMIFGGRSNLSRLAGITYFKFHILSGVLFLVGAILYYKEYKNFEFISVDLVSRLHLFHYFLLASLFINLAMPPFSSWLIEGYSATTSSGSIFLSVGVTKVAIFLLIKIFLGYRYLIYVGVFMSVYGILYALFESNIRRIINYYIISQLGVMVIATGIGLSNIEMNFIVISEIIYIALLMMIVALANSNLGKVFKVTCLIIFCAVASSLPFTPGYINKFLLYQNHFVIETIWLKYMISAISLGSAISVGIRIPALILVQKNNKKPNVVLSQKISAAVLICFTLALGIDSESILGQKIYLFGAEALKQIAIFISALLVFAILSKPLLKARSYYLPKLGFDYSILLRKIHFKRAVNLSYMQIATQLSVPRFKQNSEVIISVAIYTLMLMLLL